MRVPHGPTSATRSATWDRKSGPMCSTPPCCCPIPWACSRFAEHEVVRPAGRHHRAGGQTPPSRAGLVRPAGAADARRPATRARPAGSADPDRRRRAARFRSSSTTATRRCCRPASGPDTTTARILSCAPPTSPPRAATSRWSARTCRCGSRRRAVGLPADEYRAQHAIDIRLDRACPRSTSAGRGSTRCTTTACSTWPRPRPALPHRAFVLLSRRGSALGRVTADKQVQSRPRRPRSVRPPRALRRTARRPRPAARPRRRHRLARRPGRHRQVGAGAVRRPRGGAGAPDHSARSSCSGRCTRSAARSSATCRAARARRCRPWAQAVFDTLGAGQPGGDRGGAGARHARGAAADPHPRSLAARLVRDRRRGAVAGAQRAAHGPVPDRGRARGWC